MKYIHTLKRMAPVALIVAMMLVFSACTQNSGLLPSSSVPASEETPVDTSSLPASQTPSTAQVTATPAPTQASNVASKALWYYYNLLDDSQKRAYEQLYAAIQSWIGSDNTQTFSYTLHNPGDTVNGDDILMNVKWDNPIVAQYFNSVIANTENGAIVFTDIDDQQTFGSVQSVRQMIREIEAAADAFLSGLNPSMSDYDRYKYIAKKLSEETVFDNAFPEVPMRKFRDDSGVFGPLVNKLGVCQGFAQTYDYLCKRAGLFSLVVSGTTYSGDHAWNIIKLDDGYYHVDTTWMQANPNEYFCLTDKQIAVDHTIISQYHPRCDGSQYAYNGGKIPTAR